MKNRNTIGVMTGRHAHSLYRKALFKFFVRKEKTPMPAVYIALGSNLGDREKNCLRAIELLKEKGIEILKASKMHETEPWGVKEQPRFINMAAEIKTDMAPHELLKLLKDIEKKMGRAETIRWGPRVIDIDILLWGDLILKTPELTIPHPLMHGRKFVLEPLSEIAPDAVHPVSGKTVGGLFEGLRRKR
jgi:2-amino-4-hydroxy-6-hydroxymethyldihydropteridine diphosphokinase